jgi:hypothetical protein
MDAIEAILSGVGIHVSHPVVVAVPRQVPNIRQESAVFLPDPFLRFGELPVDGRRNTVFPVILLVSFPGRILSAAMA